MQLGRAFLLAGTVLIVLGFTATALSKLNLPLGRLPGDLVWRGKNGIFYFPWVTCLLLSLLGTLVMWFMRKR